MLFQPAGWNREQDFVRAEMDGVSEEMRFGMLETIREYAFEKRAQRG
jgi:hypothetical protein